MTGCQGEQVLVRHDPCPWLPPGASADVVRTEVLPVAPTPVVRLLVLVDGAVLTLPRADGGGPDLPTAPVGRDGVDAALAGLVGTVLAPGSGPPTLLGLVRNTVRHPPTDYPWPAPVAQFAVWWQRAAPRAVRAGTLLTPAASRTALDRRHWWPLAAFALGEPGPPRRPGGADRA